MSLETCSDFVRKFLKDHSTPDVQEAWEDHYPAFKALFENKDFVEFPSKPRKPRSTKPKAEKVKKEGAAKKPRTSYIIFCSLMREKVKSEHPELGAKEIMSMLGKRWTALTDEQKAVYKKMAEDEKMN